MQRVSTSFVRNIRKVALSHDDSELARILLNVHKAIQSNHYNLGIEYAKAHDIYLEQWYRNYLVNRGAHRFLVKTTIALVEDRRGYRRAA